MRIAYLITRMDSIGGAQVHVRDMAMAMSAEGHEVFLLCGSEGPFCSELFAQGVGVRVIKSLNRALRPWKDICALKEMLEVLGELRPDLLSLHSSKAGWLGRVAGRMLRIPTVFTAHGWSFSGGLPRHRTLLYRGLEKVAGSLSDRVVTVCEEDRSLAIRHRLIPVERLAVIHNGVCDFPSQSLARPASERVGIAMVARFQEPKKHADLLKALSALQDLPWTLEFIGDGPLQAEVENLVRSLDLESRVCFSGACSDVAHRLARAHLFVLLSAREGFPRSILEAMRAGLPVIASNVGGVREAIEEGENGFLITDGDHSSLLSQLRLLLTNPELRKEMGQAARERFVQDFTFEVMFNKTTKMYGEVVGLKKNSVTRGVPQ